MGVPHQPLDLTRLKQCKLWPGSVFELAEKYTVITSAMLREKLDSLGGCDDRTPAEDELMKALQETLDGCE
jgi:hypothetical protein